MVESLVTADVTYLHLSAAPLLCCLACCRLTTFHLLSLYQKRCHRFVEEVLPSRQEMKSSEFHSVMPRVRVSLSVCLGGFLVSGVTKVVR